MGPLHSVMVAVDEAGRCPKAEALSELLAFAEAACDGVSAVLTPGGRVEMERLTEQLRLIIIPGEDRDLDEPPPIVRADQNCICNICGDLYRRHPYSIHRSFDDYPYLRVLCDITLVKL